MANKIFWFGTLVLIFGITVVGCADRGLNGTWINDVDGFAVELKMNNGKFEFSFDGKPDIKGTYTIRGNSMISTTTHIYGSSYSDLLESKWYTKAEVKASNWKEDYIDELFEGFTETYSLSRDELSLTSEFEGESYTNTYTKKQEVSSIKRSVRGSDVTGTWKGKYDGLDVTVTITNIGWTISVPNAGYADTGTYIMDGNNGRLTSDSNGRVVGTAELIDRNTINITLNLNSVSPGTYTLKRQ